MNPPNALNGNQDVVLADGPWSLVIILVVGVIVVALLIGGFVLGMRRRSQELPPPMASEQPHRPDHPTHIEENVDPCDVFPTGGERLLPHELGGHGDEAHERAEGEEAGDGQKPTEPPGDGATRA